MVPQISEAGYAYLTDQHMQDEASNLLEQLSSLFNKSLITGSETGAVEISVDANLAPYIEDAWQASFLTNKEPKFPNVRLVLIENEVGDMSMRMYPYGQNGNHPYEVLHYKTNSN